MADYLGEETSNLKNRLLKKGSHFSFYQANRLLRLVSIAEGRGSNSISFRPDLSLGFPQTDLVKIEDNVISQQYEVTTNFLGLYGASSPLPTFYTEDLIEESMEGRECSRKFLDLINQTIYPLFFRAWTKSKPHIRLVEFGDLRFLKVFYTFLGFRNPLTYIDHPAFNSLLRFAGILTQNSKSALGLETIIKGVFPGTNVTLTQFDEQISLIPKDQRLLLGTQANSLGEDCHLGTLIKNRRGNLAIKIANVNEFLFTKLMPGQNEYEKLVFLVRYYLIDPLNIYLHLHLKPGEAKPIMLGATHWSSLGQNTWLLTPSHQRSATIRMKI